MNLLSFIRVISRSIILGLRFFSFGIEHRPSPIFLIQILSLPPEFSLLHHIIIVGSLTHLPTRSSIPFLKCLILLSVGSDYFTFQS